MVQVLTVVVIEDNPGDIRLIEELLNEEGSTGFEIEKYTRLCDALGSQSIRYADVVLLDLNLPDRSGIHTYDRFHDSFPELPVIVLTGSHDVKTTDDVLGRGAQDYLSKGEVTSEVLLRSIRYSIERKKAELAIRRSEERFALATKGANCGIWDWDLHKKEITYSDRWKSMLGFSPEEIDCEPGQWFDRVHPDDWAGLNERIRDHIEGQSGHFEHEYRMMDREGNYRWMLSRGIAVCCDSGKTYRIAGSQTDITEKKEIERQLTQRDFYDTLTGLANKALLSDRLTSSLHKSDEEESYSFAFLLMDCDEFNLINSSFTHRTGDKLLRAISDRLKHLFRPNDTFARWGGDVFVVLLDGIDEASNVLPVVERIRTALDTPFALMGERMYVTISTGIVVDDGSYRMPKEVHRDADIAMYKAKSAGRGRFEFFSEAM